MVVCALIPLWLATVAGLRILSGSAEASDDDDAAKAAGAGTAAAEAVAAASSSMQEGLGSVQQYVADLKQGQDARLIGLQKDLVGVSLEVGKLRAELARMQGQQGQLANGSPRQRARPEPAASLPAPTEAAAGASAAAPSAVEASASGAALLEQLEAGQGGQAMGGARAWRSGGDVYCADSFDREG